MTTAFLLAAVLLVSTVPAGAAASAGGKAPTGYTDVRAGQWYYQDVAETPEPILRAMAKGGWTVEFVTGGIASVYPAYGNTNGLTDAARSLICVDVHGNVLTRDSTTILHELGHFVQHNAPAWLDGALNAAYAAERDALASVLGRSDCKKSASEFFAEAYRAYRLGKCDPARTPLTCAMLDRLAADGWVAGK